MIHLLSMPVAIRLAWTLVHFLWQGALLGGLAWLCLSLLRRKRPQVRYLMACLFLLACFGTPFLTYFWMGQSPQPVSPDTLGVMGFWQQSRTYQFMTGLRQVLQPMLPWILSLYVGGLLALSLRTIGGWLYLQELKAKAQGLGAEWDAMLDELVDRLGIERSVRFLVSARVSSPMATGIWKPVVLLPLNFFTSLDPVAAEAILVHELAHIRRFDVVVNGCQCVVETLLFFHPAVWWISKRIRAEREHCCDDAAVSNCGDPLLFVEILSRLDALRQPLPRLAMAARGGNLMERMRRLLAPDHALLRIPAPSLPVMTAFLLGGTALLARQEGVKRVLVELPRQISNLSEDVAHTAHQESKGFTEGLRTWAPAPPSPHKLPGARRELSPRDGKPMSDGNVPEMNLGSAESTSEIRPIITEEVRSKTPVIETKVVNDQVKMPPCATKIGKVSENSISECWPEEVSYIESNSLPFRNYSPYVARPLDSNAYRILRLRVEPGERLSFRLQGESSKVVMEALIPAPESNLAWRNALQQANFPPPQVRQSRLEISNPTEEPRNFDLILFGVHGYAYRVEVVRKQS